MYLFQERFSIQSACALRKSGLKCVPNRRRDKSVLLLSDWSLMANTIDCICYAHNQIYHIQAGVIAKFTKRNLIDLEHNFISHITNILLHITYYKHLQTYKYI